VIYANSVLGARSNFESGPAALAAALTGRTPEYGFILTTTEKGRFQSSCAQHSTIWPTGARWASWWAKRTRITSPCRCFMAIGAHRRPMSSSISRRSCELRLDGDVSFRGRHARSSVRTTEQKFALSEKDIQNVYAGYSLGDGDARLVVFSGPQQSLLEMKRLAQLFDGRRVKEGSSCFVTTNGAVLVRSRALGYAKVLEDAG